MAYSCVSVSFEIGHEASIRTYPTVGGFTHDWEVFVRGADNTEISHFVEKVIFHLHETFPRPRRVVKEPPYSVKESGYAGFTLPIEVYFKNHDEPKKVCFNYELTLHTVGPPVCKVLREVFVFPNPAEDLRRRLIRGGGVGVVGSEGSLHLAATEKPSLTSASGEDASVHKHSVPPLVGKPKLGGDTAKKHKVKEYKTEEPRVGNHFSDLFGIPIKTTKVSPDPKKTSHSPKVSPVPKSSKHVEKSSSDKQSSASKPAKQKDIDRSFTKDEKKEKSKDRDKSKDKSSKRSSTPSKHPSTPPKHSSPPKRSSSPPKPPTTPPKRPSTPPKHIPTPVKCPSSSPKQPTASKPSKDESKKPSSSEEVKGKSESKTGDSSKSEKKKKDKKNKDEKPKKDKHKDHDSKISSDKLGKSEKSSKECKEKDAVKKVEKEPPKETEKSRDKEKERSRHGDGDKEKQRHKHKKKDKSSKERDKEKEKERDREKSVKKSTENRSSEIRDKDKNGVDPSRNSGDGNTEIKKQIPHSPSPHPVCPTGSPLKRSSTPDKLAGSASSASVTKDKHVKHPLGVMLKNVSGNESSDSNISALSDDDLEPPSKMKPMKSPVAENVGPVPTEEKSASLPTTDTSVLSSSTKSSTKPDTAKLKSDASNHDRNCPSKNSKVKERSSSKKSKEKEVNSGDVTKEEKDVNRKRKRKNSEKGDEEESCRNNGETAPKLAKVEADTVEPAVDDVVVGNLEIDRLVKHEAEQVNPTQLTEEYVSQLKELQHKIMTLEDNAELQRVVQVIAETGQYEITKKTFDFDLCALDRSTVQRLQNFFTPS